MLELYNAHIDKQKEESGTPELFKNTDQFISDLQERIFKGPIPDEEWTKIFQQNMVNYEEFTFSQLRTYIYSLLRKNILENTANFLLCLNLDPENTFIIVSGKKERDNLTINIDIGFIIKRLVFLSIKIPIIAMFGVEYLIEKIAEYRENNALMVFLRGLEDNWYEYAIQDSQRGGSQFHELSELYRTYLDAKYGEKNTPEKSEKYLAFIDTFNQKYPITDSTKES